MLQRVYTAGDAAVAGADVEYGMGTVEYAKTVAVTAQQGCIE